MPDPAGRVIIGRAKGLGLPIIACLDCDLLQRLGDVPEGATARCRRCGYVLRKRTRNGLERTLALAFAASILFVVANSDSDEHDDRYAVGNGDYDDVFFVDRVQLLHCQ